ncbi:unnamed protein product [Protopolystoma xenopodis]|uniref:Uncharacterized protein n=1 Tax=Protopolystoma xenopodis TaxID=117903 RepID=A0A448WUJ2_9PLAT|nr:unnamed protein product [Protopolystoma xenopodis]
MNPPLLSSLDRWGLPFGLAHSLLALGMSNLASFSWNKCLSTVDVGSIPGSERKKRRSCIPGSVRWAFFRPDSFRLAKMLSWLADGRIQVIVDSTYPFSNVPEAFRRLQARAVRGKLVIVHEKITQITPIIK